MYDAHTHLVTPEVYEWLKRPRNGLDIEWQRRASSANPFLVVNQRWPFEFKPEFLSGDLYLREQETRGIVHSLISPIPQLFLYDAPSTVTTELARVYNESLAFWCAAHPTLSGLATLPLNNPAAACRELDRAMDLGLKGAILAPGSSRMLTHPDLVPVWQALNDASAILFLHPLLNGDPRIQQRMMPNLIGVLWETTVAAADLLLAGYLDQYPKVRILLAHGGGYLPYHIGRMQKAFSLWPQARGDLSRTPHEYLRQYWFDSVVFDAQALAFLERLVGSSKIVPGSDYPFDLCIWPPHYRGRDGFHSLLS